MSRLNVLMLAMIALIGLPYYWFFIDNGGPKADPQPLTIAQLRDVAGADRAAGPERIRFEHVSSYSRMGNRVAAGSGLRSIQLFTLAYLLEYRDGAPVLIGSGITRSDAHRLEQRPYVQEAQERVVAGLKRARALVPLVQSADQLGGLKQIEHTAQGAALTASLARQRQADAAGVPYRAAPGVVVVPTPQLEPGSRLVFVRMADGREYLFAGNLAQINQNWAELRLPARFTTDLGRRDDRMMRRSWLRTLRKLRREAPDLMIVSGNKVPDGAGLIRYFDESGNILSGSSKGKSRWSFRPDWSNARGNVPPRASRQDRDS